MLIADSNIKNSKINNIKNNKMEVITSHDTLEP